LRLSEIAGLFLRLGATAFGGPAAHTAMIQDEVVRRRRWLTETEFLDLLGATNLIPGPNSTELAIHIGHRRAGWPGLLVAGTCFILPAALIVAALAWLYVNFGSLPQINGLLYGVKPAIIAVVLQALYSLGKTAVKTRWLLTVGIVSGLAVASGVYEILVLFGAGSLCIFHQQSKKIHRSLFSANVLALAVLLASQPIALTKPFGLWPLFLFFAKVGSVLFGSGYVLLAFLRADLVERWHWLSEAQLLDAIAVGQITPGPLFTTATFIGYLLGGGPGALIATLGIFAPAFFFVAISGPLVPHLRKSALAGAFLDGVNVASLALMAVVTWQLGRAAIIDWLTLLISAASAIVLLRYRVSSMWLVLGGAIIGLLTH
jgi:chromate transporter